jgi:hypothetical protein
MPLLQDVSQLVFWSRKLHALGVDHEPEKFDQLGRPEARCGLRETSMQRYTMPHTVCMCNIRQEGQRQPGLYATSPGGAARQAAYPHPATERERALHELLGAVNEAVTGRAVAAMQRGDVAALGARVSLRG